LWNIQIIYLWKVDMDFAVTIDEVSPNTFTGSRHRDPNYVLKPCTQLIGHTSNIRSVTFNSEHRQMCVSAGWDASIRVWDTTSGTCVSVCTDHNSDIYSVVCHPERPFTFVSCSRDTTIRVWECMDVCLLMKLVCVWDSSLVRVCVSTTAPMTATPSTTSFSQSQSATGEDPNSHSQANSQDLAGSPPSSSGLLAAAAAGGGGASASGKTTASLSILHLLGYGRTVEDAVTAPIETKDSKGV
jgi:WD40 repeat protein